MLAWKSYGFVALATGLAFFAGRGGRPAAVPAMPAAVEPPMAREVRMSAAEAVARQAEDPAAVIGWIRGAVPDELAGVIAELMPLPREAAWRRLAEDDPARLAALLIDGPAALRHGGSWLRWLDWLAARQPALLEERLAGTELNETLRRNLEEALRSGRPEVAEDPAAVLERALASTAEPAVVEQAIVRLSRDDPRRAADALCRALEAGIPLRLHDGSVLFELADAEPARIQALLPQVRLPELQIPLTRAVAGALAAADPERAFAFHESLPPSRARSIAAIEIATRLAGREEAVAWVESLPVGMARDSAMAAVLAAFVENDPRRVLAALAGYRREQDSLGLHSYRFDSGGSNIGPVEGAGVIPSARRVHDRALRVLAGQDPPAAFAILEQAREELSAAPGAMTEFRAKREDDALKATLLAQWLGRDPVAALKALDDLPPDDRRRILEQGGLTAALRAVPAERLPDALRQVSKMIELGAAGTILGHLAPAMVRADPAAALGAVEQVGADLREVWIGHVIANLHQSDPAAAIAAAAQLPLPLRATAHAAIARGLVARSPAEAIAYLDGLEGEDRGISGYESALESWVVKNSKDAESWYHALPEGNQVARHGALIVLAGRLYEADPASGELLVGLIAGIADLGQRAKALEKLLLAMAPTDPAGARRWVAEPGMELPPAARARLRMKVELEIQTAKP